MGNRLVIQALVRFDTTQVRHYSSLLSFNVNAVSMQTLEIYSRQGDRISPVESLTPRRVTEYLVLEKRMWYDVPWKIKQQMFERSG